MLSTRSFCTPVFLALALACLFLPCVQAADLPDGFVNVEEAIPGIQIELRYYSSHNFVGSRIDGYFAPKCILTGQAAQALRKVQEELNRYGLGLKVYDAYRPQRAVDHFVRWAKDLGDLSMKKEFYPHVEKANLFKEDYIAEKSGHSRGSTVDLTIVSLEVKTGGGELDMGTTFDYFGPQSWPDSAAIGADQRAHRMLLQELMKKHGFKPYPREWWHFTLLREPYPDTYFDFPVR